MKIIKLVLNITVFMVFVLIPVYGKAEPPPPTPPLDMKKVNKYKDDYEKKASKSNYKPESEEKAKLLNSYFGDFRLARRIKKSEKIILTKYDSYIKYANRLSIDVAKKVMLDGLNELEVNYDEIWIDVDDHLFTPEEKKRLKGKFNINKLYWKDNQIQAYSHERLFEGDPYTGKKFNKPSFKIIYIKNRDQILQEYSK
jgi:hypothetical protein